MRKTLAIIILLLLLVPARAQEKVIIPKDLQETLVRHKGYTVSFNDDNRIPNYVAYRLRPSDVVTDGVSRKGESFQADPLIPLCPETGDYTRSGYDRGHMMPAADCKGDPVRMKESFYLSNVCPQNHSLNEGDWCDLEKQVRFWCRHYYKTDLWIVCGPVPGRRKTASGINVPEKFWKVVCRHDTRSGRWEAAGFLFSNNATGQPYEKAVTSVDDIEALTGFDFFSEVEDSEESRMEKRAGSWKF